VQERPTTTWDVVVETDSGGIRQGQAWEMWRRRKKKGGGRRRTEGGGRDGGVDRFLV
jgi:hypothetical protein